MNFIARLIAYNRARISREGGESIFIYRYALNISSIGIILSRPTILLRALTTIYRIVLLLV